MKKILSILIVIVFLLLIAGYIESNYCHRWTTQEPIDAPKDYIKTTTFCKVNEYPGLVGSLIIGLVR